MERRSLSWPWITIRYFCSTKVCMVPYFLCSCTQSMVVFLSNMGMLFWKYDRSCISTNYAFLGTKIRWPLSVKGGLKKKMFFSACMIGAGDSHGTAVPLMSTPLNSSCPLQCRGESTLVVLLCPQRQLVTAVILFLFLLAIVPNLDLLKIGSRFVFLQSGCRKKKDFFCLFFFLREFLRR